MKRKIGAVKKGELIFAPWNSVEKILWGSGRKATLIWAYVCAIGREYRSKGEFAGVTRTLSNRRREKPINDAQ